MNGEENVYDATGDDEEVFDAPPAELLPDDPEYGLSLSIGLTQSGHKVLVMKLPVAVEGITPDGEVTLGEAILDPEDAENVACSIVEALVAMGRKPRLGYIEKRTAGAAFGAALAEVANAKVDAVAEVVAEKNELN